MQLSHPPRLSLSPLSPGATVVLIWSTLTLLAIGCNSEEEVTGDDKLLPSATATQADVEPSGTPSPVSPSPIPDDHLRAEIGTIPVPSGVDTRGGVVAVFGGEAGKEFVTEMDADAVVAFYREALVPDGWAPEGEPVVESAQHPGSSDEFTAITWSLVKDDIRLMIGAQLSPAGPSGETYWSLTIQPIWYPGWDEGENIAPPPTDTTPIPIGPDSAGE